jgi:metal transporter CNNM
MILIQDLLLNDPADKLPLRSVVDFYKRKVAKCSTNDKLDDMFDIFRRGESHMSYVYENNASKCTTEESNEAVGIVTLEDIIEELVQSEILDESDCKREKRKKGSKNKAYSTNIEILL